VARAVVNAGMHRITAEGPTPKSGFALNTRKIFSEGLIFCDACIKDEGRGLYEKGYAGFHPEP